MAAIRVYIKEGYVSKNGEAPVYASLYIAREKIELPCKVSVKLTAWDAGGAKVTPKMKNHSDLNLIIENTRKRINDILVEYRLKNRTLSKDLFLRDFHNPRDFKDFYEFVAWFQKIKFKEIEDATIDTHEVVFRKLKAYKETLLFDEIDEDFIRKFQIHLKKELKNKDTTIAKNIVTLKTYVMEAVKRKYIEINPFESIKIKRKQPPAVGFLTEEELTKLVDLYGKEWFTETQQKVLGFFLFMCFTSLHIGDARLIKMEDITDNYLTYYRIKTKNMKPEPIRIPLSKPAKKLIRRIAGFRVKGYLFGDMITDQKVNETLKKIVDLAGIDKKISAKAGRHTFATIFLRRTKDMRSLQELLGHSNITQTMVYAHVLDESKREGMEVFNDFKI